MSCKKNCGNKDIFPYRTGVREGNYSLSGVDESTGQPFAAPVISGRQARLRRNGSCLRCGPICNTNSCVKCVKPGDPPIVYPKIPKINSDIGVIRFERNVSTNSVTLYSWTQ